MKKNLNSKHYFIVCLFAMMALFTISCQKYLDAKTDKTLVIPSTLNDAQALLDFYRAMNENYPSLGNESDDNYYLPDVYFNSRNINSQNNYIWSKDAVDETDWGYMYQIVLAANIAIETIDKQPDSIRKSVKAKNIMGAAYFFRALGFYYVVQYYATPYNKSTAESSLGIPLRLSSDASQNTKRASVEQSWQQIISDLKTAINLLPETNIPLTRPSKAASFAWLANVYLNMSQFELGEKYADSCLQLYDTLMDFNFVNKSNTYSFSRFNPEVIFHSVTQYPGSLSYTHYTLDSSLYESYDTNDLRRKLYFQSNGAGTVGFTGSYDGTGEPFNGIATDEVYLIKAECAARNGQAEVAMDYLNKLLVTRWSTATFIPLSANSAEDALGIILRERRKELILRDRRWFDLRRLNQDEKLATTLVRIENGTRYTLPPNDSRYTFKIPEQVISTTGIQQNVR